MAVFKVEGGHRLHGEITPQGAKNEALQIICATLLTEERVVVHNIPHILDIMQLIDLLRSMGVVVEDLGEGRYKVEQRNRFNVGDTLEILSPSKIGMSFEVTSIRGEDGEDRESAHLVQEKVDILIWNRLRNRWHFTWQ